MSNSTIEEVAKMSGVSVATVSRVLNGKQNVAAQTRERVLKAAEQLDYHPNMMGRNLRQSRSGLILLLAPKICDDFYSALADGAQSAAEENGYHVLLSHSRHNPNTAQIYLSMLKRKMVDGIIMFDHIHPTDLWRDFDKSVPIIQCCEYDAKLPMTYVSVDDFAAAYKATNYLLSLGRRKIGLLNFVTNHVFSVQRQAGYLAALQDAGIAFNPAWVRYSSKTSLNSAAGVAFDLLSLPEQERPDAVFAVSDIYAAAVLRVARRLGLNVPKDLSVVGFDDTQVATISDPQLTTMHQPRFDMGAEACRQLIHKIKNPDAPPMSILFEAELIVRDSTCALGASPPIPPSSIKQREHNQSLHKPY